MNTRERHWLGQAPEKVSLSGRAASAPGEDRLVDVLAAAAGPATDDELAGEHAALAAYSRSRLDAAGRSRRKFASRLGKLFVSKTAVAALVGSAAAGGAFATGGAVPNPFDGSQSDAPPPVSPLTPTPHTPAPEPEADGATGSTAPPDGAPTPAPSADPPGETPDPEAPATSSNTETVPDPGQPSAPAEDTRVPIRPTDDPTLEPELPISPPPGFPTVDPPNVADDDEPDLPVEADDSGL